MAQNVQDILDLAVRANAVAIGEGPGTKMILQRLNSAIEIVQAMSPEHQQLVRQAVPGIEIKFSGTSQIGPGHPVVAACRTIGRTALLDSMRIEKSPGVRFLFVGATAGTLSRYARFNGGVDTSTGKPAGEVFFQLCGCEPKDAARIVDPVVRKIAQSRKKSTCITGMEELKEKFGLTPEGKRVVWGKDVVPANVLIFEDVGYDFTEEMWCDYFRRTGATEGYALMLMPHELLWPTLPDHRYYAWHGTNKATGEVLESPGLTWIADNANGYKHKWETWSLLLRKMYLQGGPGAAEVAADTVRAMARGENMVEAMQEAAAKAQQGKVVLYTEIVHAFGPIMVIKMNRLSGDNYSSQLRSVRSIGLPSYLHYVQVLDLAESLDPLTGRLRQKKYHSISAPEYWKTLLYCMSIATASRTSTTMHAYVDKRRQGWGIIAGKEVLKWNIREEQITPLVVAVLVKALLMTGEIGESTAAIESAKSKSIWELMASCLKRHVTGILNAPLQVLREWLIAGEISSQLVVHHDGSMYQDQELSAPIPELMVQLHGSDIAPPPEPEVPLAEVETPSTPSAQPRATQAAEGGPDVHTWNPCELCRQMSGKLGQQKVVCLHKENSNFTFVCTEQLKEQFMARLAEQQEDPEQDEGLKKLMKECRDAVKEIPIGTKHECRVEIIEAPPGCGKSYILTKCITENDGVLVPTVPLRTEYEKMVINGFPMKDRVKTQHVAMLAGRGLACGLDTIWADEFYTMDAMLISIVVLVKQPRRIIGIGDRKQHEVRAGLEGLPLSLGEDEEPTEGILRLKPALFSEHNLLVNFRNLPETVAVVNQVGEYTMVANKKSTGQPGFKFISAAESGKYRHLPQMAFSKSTGLARVESALVTVRRMQGKTFPAAVLHVCRSDDYFLKGLRAANIVALSRCEGTLYICGDGSEEVRTWAVRMGLNYDFTQVAEMATGPVVTGPDPSSAEVPVPAVPLPATRTTNDAYQLVSEVMPDAAVAIGAEMHNAVGSVAPLHKMANGTINIDEALCPRSARGNPANIETSSYRIGAGVGTHMNANNPGQIYNCLGARYVHGGGRELTEESRKLAFDMVTRYRERKFISPQQQLSTTEIDEICAKTVRDFVARGIDKQFTGHTVETEAKVRFKVKQQFKPKIGANLEELDLGKPAQGISAWTAENVMFMATMCRVVNAWYRKNERRDDVVQVLTDDGLNEEEFINRVTTAIAKIGPAANFVVTDGTMFDAMQDGMTQEIERQMWYAAGVNDGFVKAYFALRRNYSISAGVVDAVGKLAKCSGEPWTKGGNGDVMRVIGDWICDSVGPTMDVNKGDDLAKYGVHMKVNPVRLRRYEDNTDLRIKVMVCEPGKGAEFCGYTFVDGAMFPSITRRLEKLVGHGFADYHHFAQYQESLRAWVRQVKELDQVHPCIAAQAQEHGIPLEHMETKFEILESMCHISERQFLEKWRLTVNQPFRLVPNGMGWLAEPIYGTTPGGEARGEELRELKRGMEMKDMVKRTTDGPVPGVPAVVEPAVVQRGSGSTHEVYAREMDVIARVAVTTHSSGKQNFSA